MTDLMSRVGAAGRAPLAFLERLGDQARFFVRVIASVPNACRGHTREILRLVAELGAGTGALAMVGGSVVIISSLTFGSGAVSAAQAFESTSAIGVGSLSPMLGVFFTVRMAIPLLAAVGIAVTLGAATTSQIGAMRISEEIDAMEVMGIRSLPYLATTRVVAAMIAITPLYLVLTVAGLVSNYLFLVLFYDVGAGNFSHYFFLYLSGVDILAGFIQVLAMVLVVMLIHTYYGYNAAGGPAGVGEAVGRSVRASMSAIMLVNLALGMAIFANFNTYNLAG